MMNTFANELRRIPARFVLTNNYAKRRSDAQPERVTEKEKKRE